MTPLRERMLEDLRLRGLSPRTQEAYVGAVRQLAAHYHKPPDPAMPQRRRTPPPSVFFTCGTSNRSRPTP